MDEFDIEGEFGRQWVRFVPEDEIRSRGEGLAAQKADFLRSLEERKSGNEDDRVGVGGGGGVIRRREWTPEEELFRISLSFARASNSDWRISQANQSFQLCPTYPVNIIVPAAVTDLALFEIGIVRTGGRIPILSWKHPHDASAFLVRAAQRIGGERCKEDEFMIAVLRRMADRDTFHIVDCRKNSTSRAPEAQYRGVKTRYLGFENLSVLRACLYSLLRRLSSAERGDTDRMPFESQQSPRQAGTRSFLASVGQSHWLKHMQSVLRGAVSLARLLAVKKVGVLLQCPTGFDHSAVLASLAQILIDPYYRTFDGFLVLVQKEFISFGFPFRKRHQPVGINSVSDEYCPLFLLFLEAVLQIWAQYPHQFEFDNSLLRFLARHSFSALYGDFLCNSEKERLLLNTVDRTGSILQAIRENKSRHANNLYRGPESMRELLVPSVAMHKVVQEFFSFSIICHTRSLSYPELKKRLGGMEREVIQLKKKKKVMEARLQALRNRRQ